MALLCSEKGTRLKGHKVEKVFHIARLRHSLLFAVYDSEPFIVENASSQSLKSVLADFQVFSLLVSFSGSNH